MNQFIFVYGTLKKGFYNNNLMIGSYYIGTGRTVAKYAIYKHVVPYVIKGNRLRTSKARSIQPPNPSWKHWISLKVIRFGIAGSWWM